MKNLIFQNTTRRIKRFIFILIIENNRIIGGNSFDVQSESLRLKRVLSSVNELQYLDFDIRNFDNSEEIFGVC